MLRSLHIRNYVLIDSLDIDFPEGLVIITGQTGAGKSILLGALSLLMGAKADASVIGEGADNCVVEAEFDADGQPAVREILQDADLDWNGGGIVMRRVVSSSGRSRSFVNDEPVQVGVLSALSTHLIDIHSQHGSLLLTDRSFQLSVLDHFAGNGQALAECREAYREVGALKKELSDVRSRLEKLSSERSWNEAMFAKLEEARLRPGEMEELEEEQTKLSNASEIISTLQAAGECLRSGEDDGTSTLPALKEASRQLSHISRIIPQAAELSSRLDSARIEIADILDDVTAMKDKIDSSPERLQAVEDRMSQLYSLMKMHGCRTVGELIGVRDSLEAALNDSSSLETGKEELEKAVAAAERKLEEKAGILHFSRSEAAPRFSGIIREAIRGLELEQALFEVRVSEAENIGPDGRDNVSYSFSANGNPPQDVSKCASGGEISRIMLCLKSMMARFTKMPTLIFDEIDTGVSGSTADKMGSMICSMGEDMQVFAITHLPQVAAKGRAHYLVSKDASPRVSSSIKKLSPEERVMEIARLLSGSQITEAAIANARELLG